MNDNVSLLRRGEDEGIRTSYAREKTPAGVTLAGVFGTDVGGGGLRPGDWNGGEWTRMKVNERE